MHLDVKNFDSVHSSAVEHTKQHRSQIRCSPCIGDLKDGVCLLMHGQVYRQPMRCPSAMFDLKGRAFYNFSGSLYWSIPCYLSECVENLSDCIGLYRIVSDCIGLYRNVLQCIAMYRNVSQIAMYYSCPY